MRSYCLRNYYRQLAKNIYHRKFYSATETQDKPIEYVRNIGILAHIDAGKTTTTERMLYYSGTIKTMGEVHHGNTVTDYMEQERQRGITITSAAVSFPWRGFQINLIDTPGHIDFTMEVEQSLAVLDGAVVVLDGSAGVEAQTITVWRQADGYRVPRILYLNKMDRADADDAACLAAIENKLQVQSLPLHTPLRHEGRLVGLIDIVKLEEIVWTRGRGQNFTRRKLTESEDGHKWDKVHILHQELIDKLSSLDDILAETIIKRESLDNLEANIINDAIRRCTLEMKAFPVLCGSSYRNIGVQTLLDGVTSYLPTPLQCNKLYKCFGSDLCARAFKVQHDDQKGVLTFLRLYSGEIKKGQKIYNLGQSKSEQTGSLYVAYADECESVQQVTAGNIAVVSGLKSTMSGDLITSTHSAANIARSNLAKSLTDQDTLEQVMLPSARQRLNAMDEVLDKEEMTQVLLGIGTTAPDPVFLCSIEPPSAAFQTPLEVALAELQREDPSLRVSTNEETGQIILAGMGELHLEIIKERIIREYKIEVELGPLQIAYRETLLNSARVTHTFDRKIGSTKQTVTLTMSAKPLKGLAADKILRLDRSPDSAANLAHVRPRHLSAIQQGVDSALLHGPKLGCPIIEVQVTLHWLEVGRGTSESVLSAAVAQCLRKVFDEAEMALLEPMMAVEVICPESHSARVLADLTRRRVHLHHVQLRGHNKVIECEAPLSELMGYSSNLRSLSSGLASFTMEFRCHRQMSPHDEQAAIKAITGL